MIIFHFFVILMVVLDKTSFELYEGPFEKHLADFVCF